MPTGSTRAAPQTLRQAKAAYKKQGPRLSERERRQIERGAELLRRAERAKEQERRRKDYQRRREDRERKEREARRSVGIGLATQLAGYSHTQTAMKRGMERFLGVGRTRGEGAEGEDEEGTELEEDELWSGGVDGGQSLCGALERKQSSPWDEDGMDEALLDVLDGAVMRVDGAQDSSPRWASNQRARNQHGSALQEERSLVPDALPNSSTADSPPAVSTPSKPVSTGKPPATCETCADPWADFLASSTQIARELTQSPRRPIPCISPARASSLPPISTQDLDLSVEDLEELGLSQPTYTTPPPNPYAMAPPPVPVPARSSSAVAVPLGSAADGRDAKASRDRMLMPPPPPCSRPKPLRSGFASAAEAPRSSWHEFGFCTQDVHQAVEDDVVL